VLGRARTEDVLGYLSSQGWDPVMVEGDDPPVVLKDLYQHVWAARHRIIEIQEQVANGHISTDGGIRWPAIVLRTPKGWTGPDVVDGEQVLGTFRAHQVPLAGVRDNPSHLEMLESWMRSYQPDSLFDDRGRLVAEVAALARRGKSGCRLLPMPTVVSCCVR
jgi:xylulose-5-phosphate/fructose-6-phosphate phosphoketolase